MLFIRIFLLSALVPLWAIAQADIRIGIVGTDTSHTVVLSRIFNDFRLRRIMSLAATSSAPFPGGSPDIPLSATRVAGYAAEAKAKYGVETETSIADVVAKSDAISILSLDGRIHLAQAREVFPSGKPVFIDKPLAGSVEDAAAIIRLAHETHTPFFSASSMRFSTAMVRLKATNVGTVRGALSYGPCT